MPRTIEDIKKELDAIKEEENSYQMKKISGAESFLRGGAQSASLGFADEVEAGVRALFDQDKEYSDYIDPIREKYSAAQKANPIASGIGTVAGAFVPGVGIAKGASLLGAGAKAAMVASPTLTAAGTAGVEGAIAGYGMSEAKDTEGQLKDAALGGVTGAALGGLFSKAAQKLSSLRKASDAADDISVTPPQLGGTSDDLAKVHNESLLNPELRPDADKVNAAWQSVGGIDAPLYAKTKERTLQNLASDVTQQTTMAGRAERAAVKPVYEGLENFGRGVIEDSGNISKASAGGAARSKLFSEFSKATDEATQIYDSLEDTFKDVPIRKQAINRMFNRLKNQYAKTDMSGRSDAMIAKMESYIGKAEDVDALRKLRTSINQTFDFSSMTPREKAIAADVYNTLTRERNRSILNNFFQQGPKELVEGSRADAYRVLSELKKADAMYAAAMKKFGGVIPEQFGGASGIKSYLKDARKSLESYVDDLWDRGDIQQLEKLKAEFPEVFETLRKRALTGIVEGATNRATDITPTRNIVSGLGGVRDDKLRGLMLGDHLSKKFGDVQTVYGSLPEKFNPSESGTSLKYYAQMLNPRRWALEAESAVNRGIIRGQAADSAAVQKIQSLSSSPQVIIRKLKSVASPQPYAQMLEGALQRGDAAYGATYFLLQQSDPEFRKLVSEDESR